MEGHRSAKRRILLRVLFALADAEQQELLTCLHLYPDRSLAKGHHRLVVRAASHEE